MEKSAEREILDLESVFSSGKDRSHSSTEMGTVLSGVRGVGRTNKAAPWRAVERRIALGRERFMGFHEVSCQRHSNSDQPGEYRSDECHREPASNPAEAGYVQRGCEFR